MKKLLLLRGISGTGKTTLVKIMTSLFKEVPHVVCSADDYFKDEAGNYKFDKDKLGEAHKQCREKVEEAMRREVIWIIVDNTNITYQDIKPYLKMALNNEYEVDFQEANMELSVEECFNRNTHGVSLKTIQNMKDKYESNEIVWEKWKQYILNNSRNQ